MHDADLALGTLARAIPGATRVFHLHNLDFCTEADQTLRAAAQARGLDLAVIEAELEAIKQAARTQVNWARASTPALVEHLLERYHGHHRVQLPELMRLARHVEAAHADHPACPRGLVSVLDGLGTALAQHMQLEEESLFPLLADGEAQQAQAAMGAMQKVHEGHAAALAQLDRLTHGFTPPDDGSPEWRTLCAALRRFKEDLMEHIYLESNVLFERARRLAS